MQTIHLIETPEERELVKRVFRKRCECNAEAAMDLTPNSFTGDASYKEDDDVSCVFGNGAIVMDVIGGGDPELGWMVYDFRDAKWTKDTDGKQVYEDHKCKCYAISEQDLAGLCNELPAGVIPFL